MLKDSAFSLPREDGFSLTHDKPIAATDAVVVSCPRCTIVAVVFSSAAISEQVGKTIGITKIDDR